MSRKTGRLTESAGASAAYALSEYPDAMILSVSGDWTLEHPVPSSEVAVREIEAIPSKRQLAFDSGRLGRWDSALLTFLAEITRFCVSNRIPVETGGLPSGAQRLLGLATAIPDRGARKEKARLPFVSRLGERTLTVWASMVGTVTFLGEVASSIVRLFVGRASLQWPDLWLIIQESGSQALPIVSLISFLVGLILAFVGAIQLKLFGAQIYVADLVGIAMIRAMGGIMTGIIMAGRTGASFAAQIGTMQVNEEIDALKTSGIAPIDFLVLPRVVALTLMMPLLTLYADLMGILGGLFVSVTGLDLSPTEFFVELRRAVPLVNLWIGLFSGLVFGVLVSMAGCLKGMQCGRSASAVGDATRSAVVTGIVSIVVATAIITVLCEILGI